MSRLIESIGQPELASWRLRDRERSMANLASLSQLIPHDELAAAFATRLSKIMPTVSDPDMVLNNLDRFLAESRSPFSTFSLFERDPTALSVLIRIFSSSQYLSDLLIRDREAFDALRLTEGHPVPREALIDAILQETAEIEDFGQMVLSSRRFKQREILRIAFGDLVAGQDIREITEQISYLADAICHAAANFVEKSLTKKFGAPRLRDGNSCAYTIFALGKLGGAELNYSSDIDLIFVYEQEGQTDSGKRTNRQFFDRMAQEFTRLLTEPSALGAAYRVDWRLRPEGKQGPMTSHSDAFLRYYEHKGRNWERQAMVKARPVAGDEAFGNRVLQKLEPWIYTSRLSGGDIESMKALKRKIERKTLIDGDEVHNVKTGFGGIRDIEFTIQFLQLLNGNTSKRVRTNNTLEAIARLETAGCLTMQEYQILDKNYCWLRAVEHRLQIMFDLQTHTLPEEPSELAKVAMRMGYTGDKRSSALDKFRADWAQIKDLNRGILQHLLSDAFGSEADKHVPPEVDLVFDPEPEREWADEVLSKYRFRDTGNALKNLNALASETTRFLSSRRCRHFLAAIAPDLLAEIGRTPNPDQTLVHLRSVSDSIGGKGTLWELFSIHPPSMKLYVKLCSTCDYLTEILSRDPGMVDSLTDSLTMGDLPSFDFLKQSIAWLSQNAEDIVPILHAFKNDQHLRVGVRDIVGQDSIRETHRALSDIAEVILHSAADHCLQKAIAKYGPPTIQGGDCELVILALGKLGGRQPNYHSDLDVVFLYQGDGQTRGSNPTSNQHFFSELGAKIINVISSAGPLGKIYDIDCRLRPTGKSGALAISFQEFARYFDSGDARSWERLAMCKARPVYGSSIARKQAAHLATNAIQSRPWNKQTLEDLREMRIRMQENCSSRNLKRAEGGTVDVEFIIQMLQLKHGRICPEVLQSGALLAAERLMQHGYLSTIDFETLSSSYSFLRHIESRIRLMNTAARHEFPDDKDELARLAYLQGFANPEELRQQVESCRQQNRRLFDKFFSQ